MSSDPSQSDLAISVRGLSKSYRIYRRPEDRLKQVFLWGRRNLFHEFWALSDINFEARKGESVGIIGANGAGKSTLLQIIAGTTQPTAGEARVSGRVAALLELGSGFNPEFTGRENVFMNGTILGLSYEEIEQRYERIVAFADIGEFINHPIKVYSSGMVVRLAFAVAVHVDADILIVDEALSVGDMQFQGKCITKIREMLEDPTKSLLFVSHGIDLVKSICRNTLLLKQGKQISFGASETVCDQYMAMLRDAERPPARAPARQAAESTTDDETPTAETGAGEYRSHEFRCVLGDVQERWQRFSSGKFAPGRYRATVRSGRSHQGGDVTLRGFSVLRHKGRMAIALMDIQASAGWRTRYAQTQDECVYTGSEDETLQFEFTGHELVFEGLRNSAGGAVDVLLEPIPPAKTKSPTARDLYRPSEEFAQRVDALRKGSQEARITNLEVLSERGEPLSMVPSGDRVTLRVHMETDIDLPHCNLGCTIRDAAGQDLLTITVYDEQVNWPYWHAGTPRVVEMHFKAAFRPGVYVVVAGMSLAVPVAKAESEKHFDFCPNAGVFEVIDERSGRPCWGLVRLPASVEVFA